MLIKLGFKKLSRAGLGRLGYNPLSLPNIGLPRAGVTMPMTEATSSLKNNPITAYKPSSVGKTPSPLLGSKTLGNIQETVSNIQNNPMVKKLDSIKTNVQERRLPLINNNKTKMNLTLPKNVRGDGLGLSFSTKIPNKNILGI
jgi:hypothetical protein